MRSLQVAGIGLFALLIAISGIWYFAYGIAPRVPENVRVPGLAGPANVSLMADGVAAITLSSDRDVYRALGFAQGAHRTWASILLRQAALGQLALWFGDEAVEIDGHVAALRIASFAKATFETLPEPERDRLRQFADGMNAALEQRHVTRLDPVVVLRISPEPWEPWHTLAIERLFAWLTLHIDDDAGANAELMAFMDVKNRLANSFFLNGFDRSAAWAFRKDDTTYFYYRLVHGRSALPLFLDISLTSTDDQTRALLAIAGTPFAIAGKSAQQLWGMIPQSSAQLEPVSASSFEGARISSSQTAPGSATSGEWIRQTVDESVVSFRVDARGSLVFAVNDSTQWRMRWAGFSTVTDAGAFDALLTNDTPVFRIQDGLMLTVARSGLWDSNSDDEWHHRFAGGVLLERSRWTPYHVERLNTLIRKGDSLATELWSTDTYSPWAASIVPRLVDAVSADSAKGALTEAALTYLRNWDYAFDASSIAGSIFDEWATTYNQRTGRFATAEVISSDSVFVESARAALTSTVEELQRRFGPDLSTWRWERSQETIRPYPFWTYFDGTRQWFADTRSAPTTPFGVGHPSALNWGATSDQSADPPGTWNALVRTDAWEYWLIHRNHPAQWEISSFEDAIGDFGSSSASIPSRVERSRSTDLSPSG